MTTLQKTFIGAILVAAVCIGIFGYKSRRASIPPLVTATPEVETAVVETIRPATVVEPVARLGNPPQPAPTARELYERALVHLTEERHDDALADLTSSIALLEKGVGRWQWSPTPGAPPRDHRFDSLVAAYFSRSGVLADKKDYAGAIADLTRLLDFDPNFSSALANRAKQFNDLKQYDAANADFTRLIEDPLVDYSRSGAGRTNGIAYAYEYRGRMWHDARRPLDAIPDLQNAVALYEKPDNKVQAQFYLAAAYRASQQWAALEAEANSMAEQALKWATQPGGTSAEESAAQSGARWASEFLDHKASYQLEILAAVKAKLGDFTQAVREQDRAMKLLTPHLEAQRPAMQARLDLYKAGKALMGE